MEVSLSVEDRPNGLKKSYCLGSFFFLLSSFFFAFLCVPRLSESPEDIGILWGVNSVKKG